MRASSGKFLQRNENEQAGANGREGGCRLDKLGVTGSSPVPPTELGSAQTAGVTMR
jgi:hypothetical protein